MRSLYPRTGTAAAHRPPSVRRDYISVECVARRPFFLLPFATLPPVRPPPCRDGTLIFDRRPNCPVCLQPVRKSLTVTRRVVSTPRRDGGSLTRSLDAANSYSGAQRALHSGQGSWGRREECCCLESGERERERRGEGEGPCIYRETIRPGCVCAMIHGLLT